MATKTKKRAESSFQRDRKDSADQTVLFADEYEPDRHESGFAKEVQFYNNPEPAAHARPADLDPQVNGPFLDEVEKVRAEQARAGHAVSEATKARLTA